MLNFGKFAYRMVATVSVNVPLPAVQISWKSIFQKTATGLRKKLLQNALIGLGMALADSEHHIYVVMGDGECNEGSVWEAAMLLGKLKLPNLTILVDRNGLQAFGTTQDVMGDEDLGERFRAFGLDVKDIDGHDAAQIESALRKKSDRARAIICHTVKGHGVSFMEGELTWHYRSPDKHQLAIALEELGR